ncbi:MAG: aromatic amino acid transaminase [Pseudomonadota bacterium]
MFENLSEPPIDPLYRVSNAFAADQREEKIDLGVGVYKDAEGNASMMQCVRDAERHLAQTRSTKSYLPQAGAPAFLDGMTRLLFGEERRPEMARIQTVGGTGGIRLALELAKSANPDIQVTLGLPSWPNHASICETLGIKVRPFNHCNEDGSRACLANAFAAVSQARRGDVLILHGPCHNPTGLDYSSEELLEILNMARSKGVIPLIDAAYYGLGSDLDGDLVQLNKLFRAVPETMLVMSCSKTFGLYRDRIGILFASCGTEKVASNMQATLQIIARTTYSGPAAHGAEVVGHILADPSLTQDWKAELTEMRERIRSVRSQIAESVSRFRELEQIAAGRGIFAMLPLEPADVRKLAEQCAIFMPASGRVNLAGLANSDVQKFVDALISCVSQQAGLP